MCRDKGYFSFLFLKHMRVAILTREKKSNSGENLSTKPFGWPAHPLHSLAISAERNSRPSRTPFHGGLNSSLAVSLTHYRTQHVLPVFTTLALSYNPSDPLLPFMQARWLVKEVYSRSLGMNSAQHLPPGDIYNRS